MKIKYHISLFLFGLLCFPQIQYAQVDFNKTPNDDLGNIEDKYQEYFFEALKQKGIENYDRAIKALLECVKLDDSEAVVYFELGKNYVQLKNFGAAEDVLKKAIAKEPENEWYLDELYGVYYQLNDYDKALKTVKQLVKFHPDYKEDLASLYFRNKKYKLALKVLDELDSELGVSKSRDYLRNKIYNANGKDKDRIENLVERVKNNPENESNYLSLIYRYSEKGDTKKAYETATKLLQQKPNSHLVHLALYKFYLDDNEPEKAISSMNIVLKSTKIKPDSKAKVLSDFVRFVNNNPQYENDLLEVTSMVALAEGWKSNTELAQYYLSKGDKAQALKYYLTAHEKESGNFEVIKNILLLRLDLGQNIEVVALSKETLETFPSQPILYLVNGVALNQLNRPKEAIEILETGIDYIIENIKMEADFYTQLSIAYKSNNNINKSQTFAKKAEQLLIKQ
jgi:tetratricopeptide (TPR) repeat protein